jgi:hypothetical protein
MITQIIWFITWPVLIFVTWLFAAAMVKRFEKDAKKA